MIVTEDDGSQTATSFDTRGEAESAIESEQLAIAAASQGDLVAAMGVALPDDPAWVYFLHAEDGAIVYVGVTGSLADRLREHRSAKEFTWATYLPNVMERVSALRVEAMLVLALRPRLNIALQGVGNKSLACGYQASEGSV
jgi:hypothetical protein